MTTDKAPLDWPSFELRRKKAGNETVTGAGPGRKPFDT